MKSVVSCQNVSSSNTSLNLFTNTDSKTSMPMQGLEEEMYSLFNKLKALVPQMSNNIDLSKLEIIENAINYILDLEMVLEFDSQSTLV